MMKPLPFEVLLSWILGEYEARQSIFGIHRSLFHIPRPDAPYMTPDLFGHRLGTPFGPAAGPHTQLAQNIVCAWLSGGRFIELKTVQIMDKLEIPRPCIDMEDEGYNVEWSQELRLHESADEYTKAWVLIHLLPRLLGFEGEVPFDTIFNMSVGYNLEGIQSPPVTQFMDRMRDGSEAIDQIRKVLVTSFPRFADVEISRGITDSVTLSTMHGCPPDEIERIARYLVEKRGLHTTVKLNPTLLGRQRVHDILHGALGFAEMDIPGSAFEHDLQYDRAVELITTLRKVAANCGLTFGVKLSNTLAMKNHKNALPGDDMYMSGRALYPLTINLFNVLAQEFQGSLNVSFSAGADAFNVVSMVECGALPVTVASDLLKPGGYSRALQYVGELGVAMNDRGVASLADLARDRLHNLKRAAADALVDPRYRKDFHVPELPKTNMPLGRFDCVAAPCVARCPVHQDVPEYAWWITRGDYDRALAAVLARNPLPGITGYVCTHTCQSRCTRNNYEESVAIRALKRVAFEKGTAAQVPAPRGHRKVAIIGAGPSGLAAGACLALNGVNVTIFEARERPGGMTDIAPTFRLPHSVIQADVDRIAGLGVEITLSHPFVGHPGDLLKQGYDAVYVACGFAQNAPLQIDGIESEGVFSALEILDSVSRGERPDLGARVLVIGGGNTAVDAARTAQRLTGRPTTVVYRRTLHEMPADKEEREDLLTEGNAIEELASPVRVIARNGKVEALECVRNRLGTPGPDGRRQPQPVEGSDFQIDADSIIVAVGQSSDLAFLGGTTLSLNCDGAIVVDGATGSTGTDGVYAGGDVVRGPATIIEACADGRKAAEAICQKLGITPRSPEIPSMKLTEHDINEVKRMRAVKTPQRRPEALPATQRKGFELVEQTLTEDAARTEALRCLQCSTFCDKCVEVCPNRANQTFHVPVHDILLPRLRCMNGTLSVTGYETFRITQSRQIMHLPNLCNECGNCATFCVHQGRPYVDKPRLFFSEADYEKQDDNAFHVQRENHVSGVLWTVRHRNAGHESRLTLRVGGLEALFETPWLRGRLELPGFQHADLELRQEFTGERSLAEIAEMHVVLKGLIESLAYLP